MRRVAETAPPHTPVPAEQWGRWIFSPLLFPGLGAPMTAHLQAGSFRRRTRAARWAPEASGGEREPASRTLRLGLAEGPRGTHWSLAASSPSIWVTPTTSPCCVIPSPKRV